MTAARDLCPSLEYGGHHYVNGACEFCGASANDNWDWYWDMVRKAGAES